MRWLRVFGGLFWFIGAWFSPSSRRAKARRALRSGTTVLADRASVTVTGVVRAIGELVESPLSGRRGVVVHAFAELPEIDPSSSSPEHVRLTTQLVTAFELETPSAVVLVEGDRAEFGMKHDRITPRSPERERAFVVSHQRRAEVAGAATFGEIVIAPGMRVAVHGIALAEPAPEAGAERGYRDQAPVRHRVVAHPDYPLVIGAAGD